ncbi:MAG: MurR/RpiR family transcriptional regulator [Pseudomonadota bacterium]
MARPNSVPGTETVLDALSNEFENLTPEMRKAASFVLENPNLIGISSTRELAEAADVKPNTLVRMARQAGFEGYEDFREPFREAIRNGSLNFPDRARGLQSLARGGKLTSLYADMAASAVRNIEQTFARTDASFVKNAADAIVKAGHTYVLGVGLNHTVARNFTYLAGMGFPNIETIPRLGGSVVDDLSRAGPGDVLLALTLKPYRSEVVEGVQCARDQGMTVIAISDSRASPIILNADHWFIIEAETPQFFPSSISAIALLEMLMSFVIADADDEVIDRIDRFHERRHALGIYAGEKD